EGGEEAVAEGLDDPASEAAELPADQLVVASEKLAPTLVAELGGALGGAGHVREEHRLEHPIRLGVVALARHERLDLGYDRLPVAGKEDVVLAWQLDEARARNALGHIARELDGHPLIATVEHERRDGDRRQDG